MKEEEEAGILKYAMYTIFYVNDMVCNCIFDLLPHVKNKDKKTRNLYRALFKRAKDYMSTIRRIIGEKGNNFLADHNSYMDEINDECLENYRSSIIEAYRKAGIKEYEFLGYLETARSLFYFAIESIEYLVDKISKEGIECGNLKNYTLKYYSNIMENLVKRCYKDAEKEINGDLNLTKDKDVMKWFGKINENVLNYDTFYDCYTKASIIIGNIES